MPLRSTSALRLVLLALAAAVLHSPAVAAEPSASARPAAVREYRLERAADTGYRLVARPAEARVPGPRDVVVGVRASSLNRRDLQILQGQFGRGDYSGRVPLSDGAGEVLAVGGEVTRWRVGDRVIASFYQDWLEGRPHAAMFASALGGERDGMLAERVVLHEDGLVRMPAHLSFEQAATLPVAALTAWNGLVRHGGVGPGDTVLLLGTGGVSIMALQIARAVGARVAITSSSDDKLARARALGAEILVNYRRDAEWQDTVRAATGGRGVDRVLEVGGRETLPRSLAALAPGGHVALIGGLSGGGGDLPAGLLIGRAASAAGVLVGSRADLEALVAFVERHRIEPVVDRVFEFADAPAAYAFMDAGEHFGKIVVRH